LGGRGVRHPGERGGVEGVDPNARLGQTSKHVGHHTRPDVIGVDEERLERRPGVERGVNQVGPLEYADALFPAQ
jgi:hypothetical protein